MVTIWIFDMAAVIITALREDALIKVNAAKVCVAHLLS